MKSIRVKFGAKMKKSGNSLYTHEVTFNVEDDWKTNPRIQAGFLEYKENLMTENIKTTMKLIKEVNGK
jgi:hypothetical protein